MALAGCGGASGSSSGGAEAGRRTVVASFYPLAWAAARVGGDTVRVTNLTPAGTEPHDIELTPRDVQRVRSADVVLYLGGGFQPAVERAAEGAKGVAVDLLPAGERDPHIWLDPVRFAGVVRRIGRVLGRPQAAAALDRRLEELDAEYRRGLAHCRRRAIVTSHEAFGHLARRYGLRQIPITGISPEAEPTPRQLEKVVQQVRKAGATTIFFEELLSPRLAQTVARETGARTATLSPLEGLTGEELDAGEDYLTVMRANLTALRAALACS
jgi:zinc transport system substrate-binding protein